MRHTVVYFNHTSTTMIYTYLPTLSTHNARPISEQDVEIAVDVVFEGRVALGGRAHRTVLPHPQRQPRRRHRDPRALRHRRRAHRRRGDRKSTRLNSSH